MSFAIAIIIFFGFVLGLAVLPFVPAVAEWRQKTDAEPLSVAYRSEVDVRHLAKGFRKYVAAHLGKHLEQCRASGAAERGTLEDGTPFLVAPDHEQDILLPEEIRDGAAHRLVLACGDLKLPGETMFLPEVFAEGSIVGGENNIYRAMLAGSDITLGRGSTLLRWVHARAIRVHADGVLFGRASADESIVLEAGCRFQRLHAPRLAFGETPGTCDSAGDEPRGVFDGLELAPDDVPNTVDVKAGRWLVDGDLEIPAGKTVKADLVVTGGIEIRKGARVDGAIKSHKDIRIAEGAVINGSVISGRDLVVERRSRIYGPVLADRSIACGEGVVLGTAAKPTSVSAEEITVVRGTVAHGTVWAHRNGRVLDSADTPDTVPNGSRDQGRHHKRAEA